MNRAELVRRLAAHEAAAAALRGALEVEAREELEANGTAPSWRLADGSRVEVRCSKGNAVVTDEAAFIDWARSAYPGEFVEVTEHRFRNDAFRKRLIAELDEAVTESGWELPPFLGRTASGAYRSTSIIIAPETKARMAESARNYALAGYTMPELEEQTA